MMSCAKGVLYEDMPKDDHIVAVVVTSHSPAVTLDISAGRFTFPHGHSTFLQHSFVFQAAHNYAAGFILGLHRNPAEVHLVRVHCVQINALCKHLITKVLLEGLVARTVTRCAVHQQHKNYATSHTQLP